MEGDLTPCDWCAHLGSGRRVFKLLWPRGDRWRWRQTQVDSEWSSSSTIEAYMASEISKNYPLPIEFSFTRCKYNKNSKRWTVYKAKKQKQYTDIPSIINEMIIVIFSWFFFDFFDFWDFCKFFVFLWFFLRFVWYLRLFWDLWDFCHFYDFCDFVIFVCGFLTFLIFWGVWDFLKWFASRGAG